MLADEMRRSCGGGAIRGGVVYPNALRVRIVEFVARCLPAWAEHPLRPPGDSERLLCDQLCSHLNSEARRVFDIVQFTPETPDDSASGRSLDIGVKPIGVDSQMSVDGRLYSQFDVVLPIECKRLPTPKGPRRDEREYVISRGGRTVGGIQRFKYGLHGASHKLAVMIGFIQSETATHWLRAVNEWIHEEALRDSSWTGERVIECFALPNDAFRDDGLAPLSFEGLAARVARLVSIHRRVDHDASIEIQHMWISVNSAAETRSALSSTSTAATPPSPARRRRASVRPASLPKVRRAATGK